MNKKIVGYVSAMLLSILIVACNNKEETVSSSAFQENQEAVMSNAVPLQDFSQEISSSAPLKTLRADEKATMQVTVKNTGTEPWPSKGIDDKNTNRVGLGYHWFDNSGKAIREGRASLPSTLQQGSSVTLEVKIQAPSQPGDYELRFSMVQEHVAWFNNKGAKPYSIKVAVE